MKKEFSCPSCQTTFAISSAVSKKPPIRYCPFCRYALLPETTPAETAASLPPATTVSFLQEHLPESEQILFSIGPYQTLRSIGKGGMGEVFLAYDTTCGRRLALKKIRPDLLEHKQLYNRFLKEARITSQLTHPAIIPIYSIHSEDQLIYYTMPYVEGQTLKELLRYARQQEKKGEKLDHLTESISALMRIFLSICQAIAYSHSKHILHRDLKPENIIVGQYGQIVILDWGLAKLIKSAEEEGPAKEEGEEENSRRLHHLTNIGKVVGTVAYMAPERALGQPANVQTDIYSLGVILYQLLTLKHPFHRESLKSFRKNMHMEKLIDPIEIAPYRDIPRSLSLVVLKCLAPNPEQRYQTVDELIHDIENYLEGRSEWFQIAELRINKKTDWEFQENVFIAEHVALTRGTEASDWVNLMISKDSFQETLKIEARVKIGENGHGIGILLSVPEAAERQHLNDGYCLWLGTDNNKTTKLLRSTVEVMSSSDVFLKRNEWVQVRIEKIENNIHVSLNDVPQFSYISHLPLAGTHVGLLLRDADFILEDFFVFVGSQNVMVNCLAVPDAFLAHKDYATALNEYRRIGYSFPGRAEGREAMFRAGITLLEQAHNTAEAEQKALLYDLAQEEFHKLYRTPGAPLEYLGKALVYQSLKDYEEEAKCFELAYRRYPRHPLLPILEEQIVYRMHDSSRYNRQATFNFILLVIRFLPSVAVSQNTVKLLQSLSRHWESLFFIETDSHPSKELERYSFGIKLAFWLARPYVLAEIIDEALKLKQPSAIEAANALFCLIELGSWKLAEVKLQEISEHIPQSTKAFVGIALTCHRASIDDAVKEALKCRPDEPSRQLERLLLYIAETALDTGRPEIVLEIADHTLEWPISAEGKIRLDCCTIWAHLLNKSWVEAGELLHQYPLELLSQEVNLLHFLYGCWLEVTEGKEIASIHFSGVFEVPYPRTWTLFSYYLKGKIHDNQGWLPKGFLWERRQLFRQIALFYHCEGDMEQSRKYSERAQQEVIEAEVLKQDQ